MPKLQTKPDTSLLYRSNLLQLPQNVAERHPMATASIRLDETLVEKAKVIGQTQSRSAAKQIEHWAKIGRMMEDNPELTYAFVHQALMAKAEKDAGELEAYTFG